VHQVGEIRSVRGHTRATSLLPSRSSAPIWLQGRACSGRLKPGGGRCLCHLGGRQTAVACLPARSPPVSGGASWPAPTTAERFLCALGQLVSTRLVRRRRDKFQFASHLQCNIKRMLMIGGGCARRSVALAGRHLRTRASLFRRTLALTAPGPARLAAGSSVSISAPEARPPNSTRPSAALVSPPAAGRFSPGRRRPMHSDGRGQISQGRGAGRRERPQMALRRPLAMPAERAALGPLSAAGAGRAGHNSGSDHGR
jgi:hypothetical protein